MGIILILIGLFNLILPREAWYLEVGWKLKDSEPSEGAIIFNRVVGGILVVIGIFNL